MLVTLAGYVALLVLVGRLLAYLSKYVKSPIKVKSLGDWALVTGATDGIGKGFCLDLAKKGMNIVLVSRSKDKLDTVAKEIEEKYSVKTKVIAVDFTKDKDVRESIEAGIKDLNVGVLVNNVGMSYEYPEYFLQVENGEARFQALVDCNINSMLNVTRAVLPSMVSRGKGAVINMSSFSAHCGPLLSVYSGSKAFVIQFSSDLEMEYRDQGITMMCAAPYYVVSNMSKIKRASLTTPTATTYAASVLAQLGTTKFTYGYWAHDLVAFGISLLGPIGPLITHHILKSVRKAALRKKAKAAAAEKKN